LYAFLISCMRATTRPSHSPSLGQTYNDNNNNNYYYYYYYYYWWRVQIMKPLKRNFLCLPATWSLLDTNILLRIFFLNNRHISFSNNKSVCNRKDLIRHNDLL
jgi:hypothetical protein